MLAKLHLSASIPTPAQLRKHQHILFVLPDAQVQTSYPAGASVVAALLKRRRMKAAELAKTFASGELEGGALASWVVIDADSAAFDGQSTLRLAMQPLLSEHPADIAIVVIGDGTQRRRAARLAAYCALLNGAALPTRKKKPAPRALQSIHVYGWNKADDFADVQAAAEGNTLCRELTMLPPNELQPAAYRQRLAALAREHRWQRHEYNYRMLKKMGAGAFCAVAQGSADQDAAIVHLSYRGARSAQAIALVGKGICFDTGGHNLKPARYMYGMHEDMNGSAVALGILLAATRLNLPVNIDCWLAIAQNHISATAYKQNDVVTALNGTTIEIVHTDAEGRMVLADALTLAARNKPALMVDFATLTGSMHVALGTRYSGIFATSEQLAAQAIAAGRVSGERVCGFPMDEDYDSALDSTIADVKQCTLDGEADHILAVRFLKRFTDEKSWIHVDLSASQCKGGLGAAASEVTGFGVAWGLELLRLQLQSKVVS